MVTVWYAIPSARLPGEAQPVVDAWRGKGYRTAVLRDLGAPCLKADLCTHRNYTSYGAAVNFLCRMIVELDPEAKAVVTGGDDIYPDPVADPVEVVVRLERQWGGTLWVMQPTGDRWPVDAEGKAAVEKVCISPWLGREWILRAYQGRGPFPDCYYHYFSDEELFEVAKMLGCLILEPSLSQYHDHWMRKGGERPLHLQRASEAWYRDQEMFQSRKAQGFPGHELANIQSV